MVKIVCFYVVYKKLTAFTKTSSSHQISSAFKGCKCHLWKYEKRHKFLEEIAVLRAENSLSNTVCIAEPPVSYKSNEEQMHKKTEVERALRKKPTKTYKEPRITLFLTT